jgi:hypothetical protein
MSCELEIAGERVELRGDRTMFWPRRGLLAVADVHLGKTESFRGQGVALPDGVMHDDLVRLAAAVEDSGARRLVVIGDLVHDAAGVTPTVRETLLRWRQTIPCDVDLVLGNHDRRLKAMPDEWRLAIHDPHLVVEGYAFAHERPVTGRFTWLGHVHPVARLHHGHDSIRVPCFHLRLESAILPAFTSFTTGAPIDPQPGERVIVAAQGKAFDVTRMVVPR